MLNYRHSTFIIISRRYYSGEEIRGIQKNNAVLLH